MTIICFETWGSTSVGSLPSGWNAFGPSPSGWQVTATALPNGSIPTGPHALKSPGTDGSIILYSGTATTTPDMDVRFDCGTDDWSMWPILRSDITGQNYYYFATAGGNFVAVNKVVSGVASNIQYFNTGTIYTNGGKTSFRAQIIGSTIRFKFWPLGTSEPGTWNVPGLSDTSITTGKYSGLRQQSGGSSNNLGGTYTIDDLQATPGISVSPSSVLPGSTTNLTLTATDVTWTPGTPGSPTFTVSAGAKNSQVVTSSTGATLNYTASGTPGNVTITDPSSGATCILSVTAATDFSVTPSSQTTAAGVQTSDYTITMLGGLTSNENISLTDGGHSGLFAPTSLTFLPGDTVKAFRYTSLGSASGTISLQVTGTGQFSATHNASNIIASAITSGMAFATYVSATLVNLSASNATGGGGTYGYQWYRSTSAGMLGSAISGATAETCQDGSASANTDYYYTMQYTDTSTGVTANSAQMHVRTLTATAIEKVGGVGDSIMQRLDNAIPSATPFTSMLAQLNYRTATKQFTGNDQSSAGKSSVDWAVTSGGSLLANAIASFASFGVTRIVLMLGTNDAAIPTSPSTYQTNIQTIITAMFAGVSTLRTIHLLSPPFQSLTSGALSIQNCAYLIGYSNALAALANGTTVFYSQPLASYNLMQAYPDLLSDGIHPDAKGVAALGGLWASNLAADIAPSTENAGYSRSRIANE
jgi:lysophospholipase L1-like esterase